MKCVKSVNYPFNEIYNFLFSPPWYFLAISPPSVESKQIQRNASKEINLAISTKQKEEKLNVYSN